MRSVAACVVVCCSDSSERSALINTSEEMGQARDTNTLVTFNALSSTSSPRILEQTYRYSVVSVAVCVAVCVVVRVAVCVAVRVAVCVAVRVAVCVAVRVAVCIAVRVAVCVATVFRAAPTASAFE